MAKKIDQMISAHAYEEIERKVREMVGDKAFEYIFPSVVKALEKGDGETRYAILIGWLDVDSMRVCTMCGAIMEEGWYLCDAGYACSDECAAKYEGITMEEFDKWAIYKDDIIDCLKCEGKGRKIEDLTKEECEEIIEEWCSDKDYYYTEWY